MDMFGLPYWNDIIPMVDHVHNRIHQHQTFLSQVLRKNTDEKAHPNYPDVDLWTFPDHYIVEIEVPGVANVKDIHVQWTGPRSLVVSGWIDRSNLPTTKGPESAGSSLNGTPLDVSKQDHNEWPHLMVGERRIGYYERHFTFPGEANIPDVHAHLRAGLLTIKVPRKERHKLPANGVVEVECRDN